jgi:DNA-directed RNA polymerase specialized sigma24 family protein
VSFEEFVEVSSPRLVRTARMLVGSSSTEDLAQETLILMHRHWDVSTSTTCGEAQFRTRQFLPDEQLVRLRVPA